MNALVRSNPAAANLPAIVSGEFASLPVPIRRALVKIDLAFPAGLANLAPGEVDIRNDVYAEAFEGFLGVIVAAALKHLLLNNPRNPFAPTPQDVHEQCEKLQSTWRHALRCYMVDGEKWEAPWFAPDCPAPGTKGHPLTMDQVRKLGDDSATSVINRYLSGLDHSDERLNRIRPEMFDKGEREDLIAKRKTKLEEHRKAKEQQDAVNAAFRARKEQDSAREERIAGQKRMLAEVTQRKPIDQASAH